jgi:TolA-binding protein
MKEIHARISELREEILQMEKKVAALSLQEYNVTEMKNEKIKEYRNLTHERTCIELTLASMALG